MKGLTLCKWGEMIPKVFWKTKTFEEKDRCTGIPCNTCQHIKDYKCQYVCPLMSNLQLWKTVCERKNMALNFRQDGCFIWNLSPLQGAPGFVFMRVTSVKREHTTVQYTWHFGHIDSTQELVGSANAHTVKSPTSDEEQHLPKFFHMKHVSRAVEKVKVAWRHYTTAKPLEGGSAEKVPVLRAWDRVLPPSPYWRSILRPITCNFHKRGHWGGRIVALF